MIVAPKPGNHHSLFRLRWFPPTIIVDTGTGVSEIPELIVENNFVRWLGWRETLIIFNRGHSIIGINLVFSKIAVRLRFNNLLVPPKHLIQSISTLSSRHKPQRCSPMPPIYFVVHITKSTVLSLRGHEATGKGPSYGVEVDYEISCGVCTGIDGSSFVSGSDHSKFRAIDALSTFVP